MTLIVPGEAHLQALATEWHGAYHPGRGGRRVEKSIQVQHEQITVPHGGGPPVGSQGVKCGKFAPPRLPFAPLCKGREPCRRENVSIRQPRQLAEIAVNAIVRNQGTGTSVFVMVDLPLVLLIVLTVVENVSIRL